MSDRTFTVKQTNRGLTVRYQTNTVGAENLEALGVLMNACPNDAILVWDKPGQISAVCPGTAPGEERKTGR